MTSPKSDMRIGEAVEVRKYGRMKESGKFGDLGNIAVRSGEAFERALHCWLTEVRYELHLGLESASDDRVRFLDEMEASLGHILESMHAWRKDHR